MQVENRLAVHDVMHRYALAIDTKDWALLKTVFTDSIMADFRSFGSKAVFTGTAATWVDMIRSTIQGMDATQHMMGNHLYHIETNRARGTTYIQARHVCRNNWGGDTYTIGGHYAVDMIREADAWHIAAYTLHVTWNDGDRHVLRAAARRVAQRES